jgi:hypothetical protein
MHLIAPLFAAGTSSHALGFAWKHLTKEGFCTILALLIVSIFSWTVIISKARQLIRARRMSKKFYTAYRATRDPLDIYRRKEEYDGAPAYELYVTGAEEAEYHLKNTPSISNKKQKALCPESLLRPTQTSSLAPLPPKLAMPPSIRSASASNGPQAKKLWPLKKA